MTSEPMDKIISEVCGRPPTSCPNCEEVWPARIADLNADLKESERRRENLDLRVRALERRLRVEFCSCGTTSTLAASHSDKCRYARMVRQ